MSDDEEALLRNRVVVSIRNLSIICGAMVIVAGAMLAYWYFQMELKEPMKFLVTVGAPVFAGLYCAWNIKQHRSLLRMMDEHKLGVCTLQV